MTIDGLTVKAINVAFTNYLRCTKKLTDLKFDLRLEALEIEVAENKLVWQITFNPNTQARMAFTRRHPGWFISPDEYYLTLVIRKSDFKMIDILPHWAILGHSHDRDARLKKH